MVALIIWLIVIGIAAWLVNSYIPLPQPFKTLVNIGFVLLALFVIVNAFGLLNSGLPRVR
jgi:hypothetical protein